MQPIATQQEEELEKFRNQWRQEVQEKKAQLKAVPTTPGPSHPKMAPKSTITSEEMDELEEKTGTISMETKEKDAMDYYIMAVDNERQGKLGKALDGYRRAFKLNPDIDFLYKTHFQANILPTIESEPHQPKNESDGFKHIVPIGNEYIAPYSKRADPLADLIDQFLKEDTSYIPHLDYKPVAIAKLPCEIMLHILKLLTLYSVSTLPYFALVCKRFFLLSRDPSIWQYACIHVFKEPLMTLEESKKVQMNHVLKYNGHWMRMFIDRPRIRYDGVYISTCHYIRSGRSDTDWNQPIHLVTYYRYIRFFPDGTLLKHLTTNEPAQVVRLLQPGFDKQQCFHGRFLIENDDTILIEMKDRLLPRESFHLSLRIKSTHRGRHNKLIWNTYYSVSSGIDRNDSNYDLKLLKPFFFSPVKSYKVAYENDYLE
ncbi:hypothetical protein BDB01DRAFT_897115 [Pilobolus umbonatus]|nr:hypothetical protein BDB01DRAFT_897115 [Pilobolus umbonatus]